MDLFKKTMVVCAAISAFTGGAYITASGVESRARERVEAYIAQLALRTQPVSNVNESQ
jgi:uncharacterized protein YdgA (DUF945 family)